MRPDRHKQNDLDLAALRDLKHDSQVVACAARPKAGEVAFEFVASQVFRRTRRPATSVMWRGSPQKLDGPSCRVASSNGRTLTTGGLRVSRLDLAHQVVDRCSMRFPGGKLIAGLACVDDDLLPTSLGESPANHLDQISLLFNRQMFNRVEHFVKSRLMA